MTSPDESIFELHYDDIVDYLFEGLTSKGYIPSSDELLDLGDLVMDLILHLHLQMGGEITNMDDEDWEDE